MRSVPAPDVTVTPLTPCAVCRSGRYVLLEPPQEKVVPSPRSRTLAAALAVLVAFAALVLAPDAVPAASQAMWEHLAMRRGHLPPDTTPSPPPPQAPDSGLP